MIRRILCPVDFSEPSQRALDHAVALATDLKASIELVHVFDVPVYATPNGPMWPALEMMSSLRKDLSKSLADVAQSITGVSVAQHVIQGLPHRDIVQLSSELAADLIVMGTHGRTGIKRLLLGSVAERVLRTANVPTITVPAAKGPERLSPRSILAACDFSAPSRRTLELVRRLHAQLHASVTLVNVEDPRAVANAVGYEDWNSEPKHRERLAWLGQRLRGVAAEVFGPDEQVVSVRIETGPPAQRMIALATELGCDLIAAGSSGKGAIDRTLLGSVTQELVRSAHVPVLVVH